MCVLTVYFHGNSVMLLFCFHAYLELLGPFSADQDHLYDNSL